ncbi:MAG TPA: hypothetical protein ENL35_03925 [Chloroflexi bacterium]|nr:hypothetical protein [Chloroflexota bacterium]
MEFEAIFQNVTEGKKADVASGVQAALDSGASPEEILNKALIAAMTEIGRRYEAGDLFVPEMLVAAHAMQAGLQLLKPHLIKTGVHASGTVAIVAG